MAKVSYEEIKVDYAKLGKRWKELFNHYRGKRVEVVKNVLRGEEVERDFEEKKLSQLLMSLGIYLEKREAMWEILPKYLHIHLADLLPYKLVNIEHQGALNILAFSDYRVHDVNLVIDYVKKLSKKPDFIIYAGDDIHRFLPIPLDEINIPSYVEEYPEEVQGITFGFILRLPKRFDNPEIIRHRLMEIWDVINKINQSYKANKLNSIEELKHLLKNISTDLDVQRRLFPFPIFNVIDRSSGTSILRVMEESGRLYLRPSGYWELYRTFNKDDLLQLPYRKVGEDEKYAYFYIPSRDTPSTNLFEVLASYAKYGLGAVRGNADYRVDRAWIRGRNVYELHSTLVKIGQFLIVGIEGSTYTPGSLKPPENYLEADVKLRLELARKILKKNEKLIIVSHTPPHGILDRALRYGVENAGSIALREFLEEEERACLVICGHVHRCGGLCERFNNALIVNVSSHDDVYSRANIAHITLTPDGEANVEFIKLPSPLEQALLRNEFRAEKAVYNSPFVEALRRYGPKIFDYLENLAHIKFKYGLPWELTLKLYEYGVKSENDLTDEIFQRLKEYAQSMSGIYRVNLQRSYVKFKRDRERGEIYLLKPLPLHDKIIVFDIEYTPDISVLYGFLDPESGEVKQFWFDEVDKVIKFLSDKRDYVFVHWGGRDKSILVNDLRQPLRTFDLLYYVQTSLVAPINSTSLKEVHAVLYGKVDDGWWQTFFYEITGFEKLMMCHRILTGDDSVRKRLLEANKADILALKHVVEKLKKVPCRHTY